MKRITKKAVALTAAATIAIGGLGFVPYQGTSAVEAASQFAYKTFNYKVISGQTTTQTGQAKGILADGTLYIPLSLAGKLTGNSTSGDKTYTNITVKLDNYPKSNEDKQLAKENLEKLQKENESLKAQLNASEAVSSGGVQVVDGWIKVETTHFVFHYTKKSFGDNKWLSDNAEKVWDTESKWFGGKWFADSKKTHVWVKDDQGVFEGDNTSFYDPNSRSVRIAAYTPGSNAKFMLAHEMAHIFQDASWGIQEIAKNTGGQINWLFEGQADYMAKKIFGLTQYGEDSDPSGAARDKPFYTKDLKQRTESYNWSRINVFEDFNAYPTNYLLAESMSYFFETQYGHDKYVALYSNISKGSKPVDAFKAAFGKSDEELMKEFKSFYGI